MLSQPKPKAPASRSKTEATRNQLLEAMTTFSTGTSTSISTFSQKRAMVSATLLAVLLLGLTACSAAGQQDNESTGYAFVDVMVLSMEDGTDEGPSTVLVGGDRILKVGPTASVDIPSGYERIDGAGKYLMPGLAEMHGHVPDARGDDEAVAEVLFLYAANGITTVRGMLGWPGQLSLREQALTRDLVSPTLYLAGPSFNGNSINSPEQAIAKVKQQKTEGWDLLKIHPGLSLAEYDAMANAANAEGIRFGGHVPAAVGLEHAIEMGQETFDHLDGYVEALGGMDGPISGAALSDIVAKTKDAGAWVVPTMVLWESLFGVHDADDLASFDELRYVSAGQRQSWSNRYSSTLNSSNFDPVGGSMVIENRMTILRELNRAGARILMGTDAPQLYSVPGFSLHREVGRMVEAGMTPLEVLQTGTINVGKYFEESDTFGLVHEGHRADLVLLTENPLDNVANLASREGVMLRGQWLSKEYIDGRLAEIEQKYGG